MKFRIEDYRGKDVRELQIMAKILKPVTYFPWWKFTEDSEVLKNIHIEPPVIEGWMVKRSKLPTLKCPNCGGVRIRCSDGLYNFLCLDCYLEW